MSDKTYEQIAPPNVPDKRPGKVGGKRDQNRRERTASLLNAALELFLERGVAVVTIEEIAKRAGMSKGSFYRYFDGKLQLIETLVEPLAEALDGAIDACVAGLDSATSNDEVFVAYQRLALALGGLLMTAPEPLRLYLQESRSPAFGDTAPIRALADRVAKGARHLTAVAQERGIVQPLDPTVSSLAVVGASERLLHAALSDEAPIDPLTASAALIRLVLDGVRPRKTE